MELMTPTSTPKTLLTKEERRARHTAAQRKSAAKKKEEEKAKKDRKRELARLRKQKQRRGGNDQTQITTMEDAGVGYDQNSQLTHRGHSNQNNQSSETQITTMDNQNNQLADLASQLAGGGNHVTINLVQTQNQKQVHVQGNNIEKVEKVDTINNNGNSSNDDVVTKDYFDKKVENMKEELMNGQAKILNTTTKKAACPSSTANHPPSPSNLLGKFTNDGPSSPMVNSGTRVDGATFETGGDATDVAVVPTDADIMNYALSLFANDTTSVTVPPGFPKFRIRPITGTNGWIYCLDDKPLFAAKATQSDRGCKTCLKINSACTKHNDFVFSQSFVAEAAACISGRTDGLSYCKGLLSTQTQQFGTELQDLIDMEAEALEAIRIRSVKSNLQSLHEKHFNPRFAEPNTLYVIRKDNNPTPTGCIFFGQNDFEADAFDSHDEATIWALAKALGLSFRTTLTVGNTELEEEAEIFMAAHRKSPGHLSTFLAFVCNIVYNIAIRSSVGSSALIDRVGFAGPSNEVKYELNLDADILEQICQSVSCIEFSSLRLVDIHLEAMGQATDKATGLKSFTFYKCEFLVEGTNSLFVRNTVGSPMKVHVFDIPNSSFFTDCENAIKSGILSSLVVSTDTDPTRLDISKFRSVVNIHRAIIDKDLGELFYSRDTDAGPFNVGLVELTGSSLYIPSKLTPSAVRKAATVNPEDYTHERDYNKAVIEAAKSVLTP